MSKAPNDELRPPAFSTHPTDATLEMMRDVLQSSASTRTVRVLLVDDEREVADEIRRSLSSATDIELHHSEHADEAMTAAMQSEPDVILQDLDLAGLDGLNLVEAYRATESIRQVPIVVLSDQDDASIRNAAFAAGADDFLHKLPTPTELLARLRYHVRAHANLRQRDQALRALYQAHHHLLDAHLQLRQLTHADGIAGLSNRRHLDEYLVAEWRRAALEQTPLSLLMIDVDDFKQYNDQHGHLAGDDALQRVAAAIQACLHRAGDLAARFAGDEFAVVLPGTNADGLRVVAQNIRERVVHLALPHASSTTGTLSVSLGGACVVPSVDMPMAALVEAVDMAMFNAKSSGKNQLVIAR